MAKNTSVILGISPSPQAIGLAVMGSVRLLDWRVRTFYGEWSEAKLRRMILRIGKTCRRYQVTTIVVKVPSATRGSPALRRLIFEIEALSEKEKIKLYKFTLNELKRHFTGTTKVYKRELFTISIIYDHLLHDMQSKDNNYYMKISEAIALTRTLSFKKKH